MVCQHTEVEVLATAEIFTTAWRDVSKDTLVVAAVDAEHRDANEHNETAQVAVKDKFKTEEHIVVMPEEADDFPGPLRDVDDMKISAVEDEGIASQILTSREPNMLHWGLVLPIMVHLRMREEEKMGWKALWRWSPPWGSAL